LNWNARTISFWALSREEAARLAPHLSPQELRLGEEIAHVDEVPDHVLFPEAGMVSSILDSNQNVGVEISVVGREGILDAFPALKQDAAH